MTQSDPDIEDRIFDAVMKLDSEVTDKIRDVFEYDRHTLQLFLIVSQDFNHDDDMAVVEAIQTVEGEAQTGLIVKQIGEKYD